MKILLNELYREIEYPYNELTQLEKDRIEDFRSLHMADYAEIYVYYTTVNTLGCGYRIVVSVQRVKDEGDYTLDFGPTATDITDIDNEIENF